MSLKVSDLAERFGFLCSQGFGDCDVDVEASVRVNVDDLIENGEVKSDGYAVFPSTLQDVYEIEPDAGKCVVSILARSYKPEPKPAEVKS